MTVEGVSELAALTYSWQVGEIDFVVVSAMAEASEGQIGNGDLKNNGKSLGVFRKPVVRVNEPWWWILRLFISYSNPNPDSKHWLLIVSLIVELMTVT
jgi:hypothetical protein